MFHFYTHVSKLHIPEAKAWSPKAKASLGFDSLLLFRNTSIIKDQGCMGHMSWVPKDEVERIQSCRPPARNPGDPKLLSLRNYYLLRPDQFSLDFSWFSRCKDKVHLGHSQEIWVFYTSHLAPALTALNFVNVGEILKYTSNLILWIF